jgi:hypothetical protein
VKRLLRLRFTVAIGSVVLALQIALRDPARHARGVRALGTNWATLTSGEVWRLVTGVLTQDQPWLRWSILLPFAWVGIAEWHLGWRMTALSFFVCDLVSTIGTLVVLRIAAPHSEWATEQITRFDCGSSAAIYGTLAAFCASRRGPNAWIAPVLLVQSMVTIWLVDRRLSDVQHLIAVAVGLLLGVAFGRTTRDADLGLRVDG